MDRSTWDSTQGPLAQRTNPRMFELVNAAANLGFNELADVLSEDARGALKHGYLTPNDPKETKAILQSFEHNGTKVSALCVKSVPEGGRSGVYLVMGAAAAFGIYFNHRLLFFEPEAMEDCFRLQRTDLFWDYLAMFNKTLELAQQNPGKRILFHPASIGGCAFANQPEQIAEGFRQAAVWFQNEVGRLGLKNVSVQFEHFMSASQVPLVDADGFFLPGEGGAAGLLGLKVEPRGRKAAPL